MTRFGEGTPGYIGFVKESIAGPGPCVKEMPTFPVVGTGQEICEICEIVYPRHTMHSVGVDLDGVPYYVCTNAHPKGST